MGFSTDDRCVRVDFFKPLGKWYTTEAVVWTGTYSNGLIHEQFAKSLRDHFAADAPARLDMDAVCLEPHHIRSHPIQIKAGGWQQRKQP